MDTNLEFSYSKKGNEAMKYFKQGYNCTQAVFLAFCEEYGIDVPTAVKVGSSFGGGMGWLREVCGSVTGMFMVAGMIYGFDNPKDKKWQSVHYKRIQELANEFKLGNGSYVCRELLEFGKGKDVYVEETGKVQNFKKKPCIELVGIAATIMENYIKENPVNEGVKR